MGRLAGTSLVAQALAPSLAAIALTFGGADAAYGLLVMLPLRTSGLPARSGASDRV
jgi:hypothetical protein